MKLEINRERAKEVCGNSRKVKKLPVLGNTMCRMRLTQKLSISAVI